MTKQWDCVVVYTTRTGATGEARLTVEHPDCEMAAIEAEHRVLADSQCRNTVFHAEAESLHRLLPDLQQRGVRHFRVELLAEKTVDEVRRVLTPFANRIAGS